MRSVWLEVNCSHICIDERLKKLFHPNKLFGGISIIAFGDFNQLPPVSDSPIYRL